jgi:hypothetical protein
MIEPQHFPGEWCDVAPHPEGYAFVALEQPGVAVARVNGQERWRHQVGWGLGLTITVRPDGAIVCAHQDHATGALTIFDGTRVRTAGPAFGQNGAEFAPDGRLLVMRDPDTYEILTLGPDLGVVAAESHQVPFGTTSQGFLDEPELRFTDLGRFAVPGLLLPNVAGVLSLGQHPEDPPRLAVVHGGQRTVVYEGLAYEPHVIEVAGGWVAAARTSKGALLLRLALPFAPDVPPPAPPPPPPPPTPEKPRVQIPDHFDTLLAVSAAHPHLLAENSRASMTELLWRAAYALQSRDPNWGLLSKSAGENHTEIPGAGRVAVDALAYGASDEIVDIFRAAYDGPGTGGLTWSIDHRRPSNVRVSVPAPPGVVPKPTEPPPPPAPQPPPVDSGLRTALELIFAQLANLGRRVEGLEGAATRSNALAEELLALARQQDRRREELAKHQDVVITDQATRVINESRVAFIDAARTIRPRLF